MCVRRVLGGGAGCAHVRRVPREPRPQPCRAGAGGREERVLLWSSFVKGRLQSFPPGPCSVRKGVTVACLLSRLYRERKAPLTELKASGADAPPGGDIHVPRRADIPVFQELCACIYEPALLPPNTAAPQAESPVLQASSDLSVGRGEIQRGW